MKLTNERFTGSRAIKKMLGLLVILVVADGILTNVLIYYDIAWESNPFLMNIAGSGWLIIIKIIGAVICALILWDIYRQWPRLGIISIYAANLIYLGIVVWNKALLIAWIGRHWLF